MITSSSNRPYRPNFKCSAGLLFLTLTLGSACVSRAQTPAPQIASSQIRIAEDLALLQKAEQQHRSAGERGALWAQLALEYHHAADFLKAEDAYNQSLHLLKDVPAARAEYATTLEYLAALYLIYGRVDEAERVRRQALAVREKLGNRADIGLSHVHLADVALARHQYKKAEHLALQGIEDMDSSSTPPRVGLLSAFITVTYARCSGGHPGEGLVSARQAIAFAGANFEADSAAIGFALETLGFAEWKNGSPQDGEKAMLRGIQILRTTLVPADPRLSSVLLQYGDYLAASSRRVEAQEIHDEVDRMTNQAGLTCAACTVSVYSLSKTLR